MSLSQAIDFRGSIPKIPLTTTLRTSESRTSVLRFSHPIPDASRFFASKQQRPTTKSEPPPPCTPPTPATICPLLSYPSPTSAPTNHIFTTPISSSNNRAGHAWWRPITQYPKWTTSACRIIQSSPATCSNEPCAWTTTTTPDSIV